MWRIAEEFSEGGFTFDCRGAHIIYSRDGEAVDLMPRRMF